jgi:uncharacterized protein (DUF1501 family)
MMYCHQDDLPDFDPLNTGMEARMEQQGCAEAQLLMNRRSMMGLSVGLFSLAFAPRIASAAGTAEPRLLIVLLRGGLDGLNVLPCYTSDYSDATRGSLYLRQAEQLDLGPGSSPFKLNRVMKNVHRMYLEDDARFVLPIAPPLRTRSHFDCAFNLENGQFKSARSDSGWLNRLFANLSDREKTTLGLKPLQIGNTPVILTGGQPVLAWSPWSFRPDVFNTLSEDMIAQMYRGNSPRLAGVFTGGMEMNNAAVGLPEDRAYTNTLQRSFIGAARLFAEPGRPRVAVLTVDNFDAHVSLADNTVKVLGNLDTSLGLFRERAKADGIWDKTIVVCVSEFGRTVSDNSKGGSDHGIGTTALIVGGAVKRRGIMGNWPDLGNASALAANNDIPAVYDTRDLFKAILKEHLDIADDGTTKRFINTDVFPGVDTLPAGSSYLHNVLG